jgi:hypothetical protein
MLDDQGYSVRWRWSWRRMVDRGVMNRHESSSSSEGEEDEVRLRPSGSCTCAEEEEEEEEREEEEALRRGFLVVPIMSSGFGLRACRAARACSNACAEVTTCISLDPVLTNTSHSWNHDLSNPCHPPPVSRRPRLFASVRLHAALEGVRGT